ncbi:hypothetical protein IW140_000689 [Coemansia sp. RSA 1813]|nr:hypothetical protein EV178_000806 [Coemansia sp. RSA 1646]KAJ1773557.1 hypothetical protein LPJ74_000473 [Coemansia sp. RSA 1843]KAJ2092426.1 hypothetical protein IW138_001188 [Coemansia sp. RSA 986]KAJ2217350.1 hypothetical protein EV179_000500 [Coemansia sp. RSA 487]KAJ2572574.1 hypothetical protein IW140_000689 [Coemansia sp. RSA 1813]
MTKKLTVILAALALAASVSGQCSSPVSRPEIRSLSPEDRARFFQAANKLRENGELARLSKMHVDNADTIHGHPVFLAFHRVFSNDFALALNKVDPGVPVPYWDWSLDATDPASSAIFTDDFCGGNGAGPQNCVQSGPFANWQMTVENQHCLARKFNQGDKIAPFWPPEALLSMQQTCTQYGALSSGIENGCHGAVHLGISGDMSTMFAPNDPFFFLHHLMIDKLWYDWQLMGPESRFQMYDNVNYQDPPVSPEDVIPGYPNMRVKDALDPRNGLCYVYVDSGSGAATKRLMEEINKQSASAPANGTPAPPSASPGLAPTPGQPSPAGAGAPATPPSIANAASLAGNGIPSADSAAQLNALTNNVSKLSGNNGAVATASAALHGQQMNFLQNAILNGLSGNGAMDMASALINRHHRFLRRHVAAVLRREENEGEVKGLSLDQILTGVAGGLLGKDGLVGHLVNGLGHVVQVLPQGLAKTLQAVGSIAETAVSDVFDILKLPKVDISKIPEQERQIPYVAEIPDWWYAHNNLNATYAAQLRQQVHDMIDGYNRIPGYVSPAVIHYAAKKYGTN